MDRVFLSHCLEQWLRSAAGFTEEHTIVLIHNNAKFSCQT